MNGVCFVLERNCINSPCRGFILLGFVDASVQQARVARLILVAGQTELAFLCEKWRITTLSSNHPDVVFL